MEYSAGILCFRRVNGYVEVLLAHPGGPYYLGTDFNSWGIPKGKIETSDPIKDAIRELKEEINCDEPSTLIYLGEFKVHSKKLVKIWMGEKDFDIKNFKSNTCILHIDGKDLEIYEIDKCNWFDLKLARKKANMGQKQIIDSFEKWIKQN